MMRIISSKNCTHAKFQHWLPDIVVIIIIIVTNIIITATITIIIVIIATIATFAVTALEPTTVHTTWTSGGGRTT